VTVDEVVAAGGEPDDVLRAVVASLVESSAASWAGIYFAESGELVLGPEAGTPAGNPVRVPVVYAGTTVAELAVEGSADQALLEHVAGLIGEHCLVGWDTGGAAWDP
jgi:putative methionine-R-sulfoxide reductase with GAF domain